MSMDVQIAGFLPDRTHPNQNKKVLINIDKNKLKKLS